MKKHLVYLGMLAISVAVLFYFIKAYLSPIFSALILAYIFYPIFKWLHKHLKSKSLSAFIVIVFMVLIVIIPSYFMVNSLIQEANAVSNNYDLTNLTNYFSYHLNNQSSTYQSLNSHGINLKKIISKTLENIEGFFVKFSSNFLVSISHTLINLGIMFFVLYYLLVDGDKFVNKFKPILRAIVKKKKDVEKLYQRFYELTYAVIYATLLTAILQGLAAGIGYWLFGIRAPVLLMFATIFAALLPYVGAALIWMPVALIKIGEGVINSDPSTIFRGVGLIFYGSLIISLIDNIVKPKLIGRKADIHPTIILFGIVSGVRLFGFIGVFAGPLIITLLIAFIGILWGEINET